MKDMKVKDLVTITGGNTKVRMVGTNAKSQFVELWTGIVDDIDFNGDGVPFGDYNIQDISVINGEDSLLINIDDEIDF